MLPSPLTDIELKEHLKQRARDLGFSLLGVASAARPDTLGFFQDWLRAGFHGTMEYLPRRAAAYEHPSGVQVGVKSILMAAMNYGPGAFRPAGTGQIAAYAQGPGDYHDLLRAPLKSLAEELHQHRPGTRTRMAIDTAPLLERDLARRAGIGWFGKNTMLINKREGSYFFLSAILTDLDLPADEPHETSHCGTCTLCLEACPTGAFPEPYVLDASRCISYLTIELRDQQVPLKLRNGMEDWIFGCDVCQQVCPWNRRAPGASQLEFRPERQPLPSAEEWVAFSEEQFEECFGKTPFSRPGRIGMARNAAIAMGNSHENSHVPALSAAMCDESPLVRAAAAWALGEMTGRAPRKILEQHLVEESDAAVRAEIQNALLRQREFET